jgi:formamidopyrimidine-DNA glycosylase
MPELAEVEFFRRQWDPGLGRPVVDVGVHAKARVFRGCDVPHLRRALAGAVFKESRSHGKHLLFRFSGDAWLGVHLGMTGALRVDPVTTVEGRHDHLVLQQVGGALVFADSRMFGRVRFDHSPGQPPEWWRKLPPAVLDSRFSTSWVDEHLRRRVRAPIKAVLLDQAVFPGIGNWMADEILWRLGWHPLTPVGALDPDAARALRHRVRWVARRALATIGQDWRDPPVTWLYGHRWVAGTRCPRPDCHTPLVRSTAAGRTTCWCPACQPDPCPDASRRNNRSVSTGRRRTLPYGP